MQEIAAVLCGRDLQTLTDLEQALRSPGGGVRLRDEAARIYEFPDGTVYHFTVRPVQDKYGIPYTEVMATDVTQLATLHAALQQENERLADANRRAKRLYDNMPDIVREEEILKMKMRVHDDIGHTLLAARRALRHEHDLARLRSEAAKWESSISLLCRARQENAAEDPLSYMQKRAAVLGATVQLRGAYPAARTTRELYALILRECTSNGVRHAGATELYADSEHRPQAWLQLGCANWQESFELPSAPPQPFCLCRPQPFARQTVFFAHGSASVLGVLRCARFHLRRCVVGADLGSRREYRAARSWR